MGKVSKKKSGGIVERLQKGFLLGKKWYPNNKDIPQDIKEGHFAVVAVDVDRHHEKRFVVPLSCLDCPPFLRLLERAAEEYGFDHEGALTIPCQPSELERALAGQCVEGGEERGIGGAGVAKWNATMVESC